MSLSRLFVAVILLSSLAFGTARSVTKAGTDSGNCAASPCLTIAYGASQMSASGGDTLTVGAGTYAEHVTLKAGAVNNQNIYQVNGTDLVYVLNFVMASHTKLSGFHIQNPSSPNSNDCVFIPNSTTDIFVTGNDIRYCGVHSAIYGGSATFVYIQNNTIAYPCVASLPGTPCAAITFSLGNHWLVEGNDLSHGSDGIYPNASYTVVRGNFFHDFYESDCTGTCHIDFVQGGISSSTATLTNVLIEGNIGYMSVGPNSHGAIFQGYACGSSGGNCNGVIFRFNTLTQFGSAAMVDDNAVQSTKTGYYNVKSYNNTFANMDKQNTTGIVSQYTYNSTGGAEINNLYYFDYSTTGLTPITCDTRGAGASTCAATSPSGPFTMRNNMAWCTGASCNLFGQVYTLGLFTDTTSQSSGNTKTDPNFVNYAATLNTGLSSSQVLADLSLQAGSSALAGGTALTTVTGGCGTNTLTVADGTFFQDGASLIGVSADKLAIGTVSNVATLSSASGNTLVFTGNVTCNTNDSVWLKTKSDGVDVLTGSAPNIGALGQGATAPYTMTGTGSGTGTGTVATTQVGHTMSYTSTAGVITGTITESHNAGDSITLQATATAGSFAGWGGYAAQVGCSTNPTCSFTFPTPPDGNGITISAGFTLVPTITVATSPSVVNIGGSVSLSISTTNVTAGGAFWTCSDSLGNTVTSSTSGGNTNSSGTGTFTPTPTNTTVSCQSFSGGLSSTIATVTPTVNPLVYGVSQGSILH